WACSTACSPPRKRPILAWLSRATLLCWDASCPRLRPAGSGSEPPTVSVFVLIQPRRVLVSAVAARNWPQGQSRHNDWHPAEDLLPRTRVRGKALPKPGG